MSRSNVSRGRQLEPFWIMVCPCPSNIFLSVDPMKIVSDLGLVPYLQAIRKFLSPSSLDYKARQRLLAFLDLLIELIASLWITCEKLLSMKNDCILVGGHQKDIKKNIPFFRDLVI